VHRVRVRDDGAFALTPLAPLTHDELARVRGRMSWLGVGVGLAGYG